VEHEDMESHGMCFFVYSVYVFVIQCLCLILDSIKTVLPLGEDPPAITSLCFNHNGKILAASAVDGMIHMFGILNLIHLVASVHFIYFVIHPLSKYCL